MAAVPIAFGILGFVAPYTLEAQNAQASTVVLKKHTMVSATLPAYCFSAPSAKDTIEVLLGPAAYESRTLPRLPGTFRVRVAREPDEVRGGVHFARFQIVRITLFKRDTVGRFGTLYPDAESVMSLARGANLCIPAGIEMNGDLSRTVRVNR
jgi:hypothetical protein